MSIVLCPGTAADAAACGTVCFEAFDTISRAHGFPSEVASSEAARGMLSVLLAHPGFYSIVAENAGRIVGSNFMDERSVIAGVGPLSVDPHEQNSGVGGRLMQNVLDRAARQNAAGVRLLQASYHSRSLCLYTRLGFRTREPVSVLQGPSLRQSFDGYDVRSATAADLPVCSRICHQVHGFDRRANCKMRSRRTGRSSSNTSGRLPATRPALITSVTPSRRPTGT